MFFKTVHDKRASFERLIQAVAQRIEHKRPVRPQQNPVPVAPVQEIVPPRPQVAFIQSLLSRHAKKEEEIIDNLGDAMMKVLQGLSPR